jgi:1-deoxy-D-xylulose-5-phosphate synthase
MAKGTGLSLFQERFPDRFFDVGITEQHAVTFAAGLAHAGMRPVVAIYATFMQRAVDQVIHDIALPNLPVVIALDRAGFVGEDGETHQGLYDVALFRSIPNVSILSPASGSELDRMVEYAVHHHGPVLIRYPKAECGQEYPGLDEPLVPGRGAFVHQKGAPILIVSVGGILPQAEEASRILAHQGIETDLYNLRFLKPLDEEYVREVVAPYKAILLVEEAARQGGMGERIGSLLHEWRGIYRHLGAPDSFIPHASREELLAEYCLDGKGIASAVLHLVEEGNVFHRRILSARRSSVR